MDDTQLNLQERRSYLRMGYTMVLLLMAVLFLLFTVPTKAIDTGQVIKEKVVTVHPTAYAVIGGTEAPATTPLANRYSPGAYTTKYDDPIRPVTLLAEYVRPGCPTTKTQFNKALEAKPVKSDYGI